MPRITSLKNLAVYTVLCFALLDLLGSVERIPYADGILIAALIYAVFWRFSHEYRIDSSDRSLRILSGPFRALPVMESRIPFKEIEGVEKYEFRPLAKILLLPWLAIPVLGNLRVNGWVLIKRKRSDGFILPPFIWRAKLLVTPPNPDTFCAELRAAIGNG